jgi:hypothetical protein
MGKTVTGKKISMSCTSIQPNRASAIAAHSLRTIDNDANNAIRATILRRIVLYGMLHAMVVTICFPGTFFGRSYESIAIAGSIAHSWKFADPYRSFPTGPTAHLAPLFPMYLGFLLHWIGDSRLALATIATISNSLVFGLLLAMLPAFAKRVFHSWAVGVIAPVVAIFVPAFQMFAGWEALYTAAALLLFCQSSLRFNTRSSLSGLFAGLLGLLNPTTISFVVAWGAGLLWMRIWTIKHLFASAVIAALVCAPWMIRNYLALGTFTIRDSLGLELQVNNNDTVGPPFSIRDRAYDLYHPDQNVSEARTLLQVGEATYMARKFEIARQWITTHPGRFASLAFQRFCLFWLPEWRNLPFSPIVWALTFLSLPSILSAFRRGLNLESLLAVSMLMFAFPYYFVCVDSRYRIPILWITVLFAWQTIRRVYESWTRNDFSASSIYRACMAVVE